MVFIFNLSCILVLIANIDISVLKEVGMQRVASLQAHEDFMGIDGDLKSWLDDVFLNIDTLPKKGSPS